MAAFHHRYSPEPRHPEYAGRTVEPRRPTANRDGLDGIDELPWNRHLSHVVVAPAQSRCLFGTGTVHTPWSPIPHLLNNGQYRRPPPHEPAVYAVRETFWRCSQNSGGSQCQL